MKIRQITANDPVSQQLLARVEMYSTLLRNHVEFYTAAGTSTQTRKMLGDKDINARAIGDRYTPQVLAPEFIRPGRKIFGDTARVDVAYERMAMDISSELLTQVMRFGAGIANKFHNLLINGDSAADAKDFDGVKKLTPASQTVSLGANGLKVDVGIGNVEKRSQQRFLEGIDEVVALTRGMNKVILTNAKTLARLNTIAREYINYQLDSFGKRIAMYNGMPIVNLEDSGADIIPFTEKEGTSSDCASLYVASFGEAEGLSFFTTRDGFMAYPVKRVDNFYEQMVELICDSALVYDRAIARLSGIRV